MAPKETLQKLRRQEREVRRNLIVDAARTVFGSKTYDRASMKEIASEAGIAKSSIYTYFPSQEALFVEVAYRDTARFVDALEHAMDKQGTPDFRTIIHHFIDFCTQNEAYWRMITRFALYGKLSRDSIRKLDVVARRLMDLFESTFEARGASGDTRLLSHALFASVAGILLAFRRYPGRTEAENVPHMKQVGDIIRSLFDLYVASNREALLSETESKETE